MSDSANKVLEKSETEVWNAISAFEQILEAIPDDRVALQTIYEAYEMLGDTTRALDYVVRLGQVIIEERDESSAQMILDALNRLDPTAQEHHVEELKGQLVQMAQRALRQAESKSAADLETPSLGDINVEMNLAWELRQANELDEAEYSAIVQDLTDTWSKDVGVPVSVLHVLSDQESKSVDRVLNHLSKRSGLAVIALTKFDISMSAVAEVPNHYVFRRGAIPFDFMGEDLLVAILNPYDQTLQNEVQKATKKKCHFCLVSAEEYNFALEIINKATDSKESDA